MNSLELVCGTHPGRVRHGNEDAVFGDPLLGLAVLADGMGGHNAGDVASRIAVDQISAELGASLKHLLEQERSFLNLENLHEDMRFAVERANRAIVERARRDVRCESMGCTLVMAVLHQDSISIAHLGDSRAYRFRNNRLQQLTRDHSWIEEQVELGLLSVDSLLEAGKGNIVTRALGVGDDLELEVHEHSAEEQDVFLLCSDGLSDMLDSKQMESLLQEETDLDIKVQKLIACANEQGGSDNISVILIRRSLNKKEGWVSRLMQKIAGNRF